MPLAMFEFAVKALEALVHLRWRFSQSAAHLPRGFVPSCYSLLIAEDNIHKLSVGGKTFFCNKKLLFITFFNGLVYSF